MNLKFSKEKVWDYFILTARVLLAWTFFGYGYGKLTGTQFGLSEIEMATPLKDLSLFRVSWFLFDHEPFKSFIGIMQIICSLLLFFNRTALLGAFLFLPIVSVILVMDLTFMPPFLANGFVWRLSFYILLDFLIIWNYKDKLKPIWDTIWKKVNTKRKFPVWAYLLLPIFAIALEIAGVIPRFLVALILDPSETIEYLQQVPELFLEVITRIRGLMS